MYVIMFKIESYFSSLIQEANLCMSFDAGGLAHPVHEMINEEKVAFSNSIIFWLDFSFLIDLCNL